MASEATVRVSLAIRADNINYPGGQGAFTADVTGRKGPTPGAFTATTDGTDVDLSQLTTPGWAHVKNLDATNYVQVGVWDSNTSRFYPLLRLLAGESVVVRLDADIGEEYEGTGTGTGTGPNTLRVKANTASCVVLVEAFEA